MVARARRGWSVRGPKGLMQDTPSLSEVGKVFFLDLSCLFSFERWAGAPFALSTCPGLRAAPRRLMRDIHSLSCVDQAMHDRRWSDIFFNRTGYVPERLLSYAQRLRALVRGNKRRDGREAVATR